MAALFLQVEPHLHIPRGNARRDDRREVSGLIQVLKSGGRWINARPVVRKKKDALQPRRSRSRNGGTGGAISFDRSSGRVAEASSDQQHRAPSAQFDSGRKRGEANQTPSVAHAAGTTANPSPFVLTSGQGVDCAAAAALVERSSDQDITVPTVPQRG